MQNILNPKISCEKIDANQAGESGSGDRKASAFDKGRGVETSLPSKAIQAKRQNKGVENGNHVVSSLVSREEFSNNYSTGAKTFKNLKRLIVGAKEVIISSMASVNSWLACSLEVMTGLSSQASVKIRRLLPEPYAGFANQFMFGAKSQASNELYQLFKTTGMLDLLVISGFHLQITASLCYASINKFLTKTQSSIFVLLCIWGFMMMLPQSIPVARAVLATTVALTAKLVSRSYNPKLTLCAIAACMILQDRTVVVSLSFQLSFLASAVILWLYPIITGISSKIEEFKAGSLRSVLVESFLLSLIIGIAFAPLLSYYFGYFSLVSLFISPIFSIFLPLIFIAIWMLAVIPDTGMWFEASLIVAGILKGILEALFALMTIASRVEILSFSYKIDSVWALAIWYFSLGTFVAIIHFQRQKRLLNQVKMNIVYD
jgi:competence protein ComEC